jgi:hypothetical protein
MDPKVDLHFWVHPMLIYAERIAGRGKPELFFRTMR